VPHNKDIKEQKFKVAYTVNNTVKKNFVSTREDNDKYKQTGIHKLKGNQCEKERVCICIYRINREETQGKAQGTLSALSHTIRTTQNMKNIF
jgi:hypothetical protein